MRTRGTWIPLGSFVLAIALSMVAGSPDRARTLRAQQSATFCQALGVIQEAKATAKAFTFAVTPPVKIRVDCDESSKIEFGATLNIQLTVTLTADKKGAQPIGQIVNLTETMKPKKRPRSYSGAVHMTDLFGGFDLDAKDFEKDAIKAAQALIHQANQTLPPGLRFPLGGATAFISAISPGTGNIVLDGTYVCIRTNDGGLTGCTIPLDVNNQGNGAGQFPAP